VWSFASAGNEFPLPGGPTARAPGRPSQTGKPRTSTSPRQCASGRLCLSKGTFSAFPGDLRAFLRDNGWKVCLFLTQLADLEI
jgi:hypothetical protein